MNNLLEHKKLFVKQRHELAEIFGFETRNKYEITDQNERAIGYAAEQQKSFLGFLFRQMLGHWRSFEIHFFDLDRNPSMKAIHPFRWFFQHMDIYNADKKLIGSIDQRFALFSKKFDVIDDRGTVVLEVASGFFSLWTFEFMTNNKKAARISKKWSGLLAEVFTDKDKFLVEFINPAMTEEHRQLVLAAALFIDLQYFEAKANNG